VLVPRQAPGQDDVALTGPRPTAGLLADLVVADQKLPPIENIRVAGASSPSSCARMAMSITWAARRPITAIEKLDSDCLPRLSRKRENQFGKAKTAYDKCKEILAYKKDNKLCK
jgi:hypothetical protein